MNTFTVELNRDAEADLLAIDDVRTRKAISAGLLRLETEPAKRGKPLGGDLAEHYSIRLAGQRYRAVYTVAVKQGVVTVVVISVRKAGDKRDTYRIASKRLGKR